MIAGLLAAAALAAGPVPLLDAPHAQDVALAGDAVVVARPGPGASARVDVVPRAGGLPRNLLVARAPGPHWTPSIDVAASAERVAVVVFNTRVGELGGERYRWRLYTGPTTGPLQLELKSRGAGWVPSSVAADGDRVVVVEAHLRRLVTRARLLAPGAAPRVLPLREVNRVAVAGDHLAFTTLSGRMIVTNLASGARESDIAIGPGISELDVAADGRAVTENEHGLVTVAPGGPATAVPGSGDLLTARIAGAGIAAIERTRSGGVRPVVLDAGATAARPVGLPSLNIPVLDADERGLAWVANGCVVAAPVGATPPAEPLQGPCPRVEVLFEDVSFVLRGRAVRLRVTCVSAPATGCSGTAILRLRGVAGRGRFHVQPGATKTIDVRLTRRAARLVRRLVRRDGDAILRIDGRVRGGRRPGRGHGVLINRVS